jgi:hypothetical protein
MASPNDDHSPASAFVPDPAHLTPAALAGVAAYMAAAHDECCADPARAGRVGPPGGGAQRHPAEAADRPLAATRPGPEPGSRRKRGDYAPGLPGCPAVAR